MDFQGIYDHLKATEAPGLIGADEPRPKDPEDKKDKGRYGDAYVIVEAQRLSEFLKVCRDDPRLGFEVLADLTAVDPAVDDDDLWICVQLLSTVNHHRLAIKAMLDALQAK